MTGKLHVGGTSDPLNKASDAAARDLLKRFSQLCDGYPRAACQIAAMNVLLNTLRQDNPTRAKAEAAFDELFGKFKSLLLSHYDGAGKRRHVFPHDQTIVMPMVEIKRPG